MQDSKAKFLDLTFKVLQQNKLKEHEPLYEILLPCFKALLDGREHRRLTKS